MQPTNITIQQLLDTSTPEQVAQAIADGQLGDIAHFLTVILTLRDEVDAGERRLITLLHAINLSGIWRAVGPIGTFENFLERHAHVGPVRYHNGLRTIQVIPMAVIRETGFEAAKVVAKIDDPQRREEAIRRVQDWTRANARPASSETARRLAGLGPSCPSPATRQRMSLEEENEQLRAEIQRLRNLVVSLGGNPDTTQAAE